jgi:hypothetical protein
MVINYNKALNFRVRLEPALFPVRAAVRYALNQPTTFVFLVTFVAKMKRDASSLCLA